MNFEETKTYLESIELVDALWWFIECCPERHKTDVFFYLRERVRNHKEFPMNGK